MKILVVIPARAGSKRLPGKNIRVLGDKPLIVWSINVAKNNAEVCDILISTDSPEIAEICTTAGALVPWLRPAELATDTAKSVDVVLHALDWYENENGKVDGVLLLQPTSPFRSKETVCKGIELFDKHCRQPVLGISPTNAHPMWTYKIEGGYVVPFIQKKNKMVTRSQDLPPAYVVNGSFYLISPTDLRERRSFVVRNVIPLLIESPIEALDIDTAWDLTVVTAALVDLQTNSSI